MGAAIKAMIGLVALGVTLGSPPAHAAANLVTNGNFEQFTNPSSTPTSSYQLSSPNTSTGGTLAGWASAGYTFLFNSGTADTTGAFSSEYNNAMKLWGPNSGSANGLTASSPTGGNFLGSDGAYEAGALSQSISGLVIGYSYNLSFYWGGAQQTGYDGATTEGWGVTFGNTTYNVSNASTGGQASHGFTPWRQAMFTFVATSTTQTLSFLAAGTPSGTPPFSLLDGVVLMAPEPATWAMMMAGLAATALTIGFRRRAATAKA